MSDDFFENNDFVDEINTLDVEVPDAPDVSLGDAADGVVKTENAEKVKEFVKEELEIPEPELTTAPLVSAADEIDTTVAEGPNLVWGAGLSGAQPAPETPAVAETPGEAVSTPEETASTPNETAASAPNETAASAPNETAASATEEVVSTPEAAAVALDNNPAGAASDPEPGVKKLGEDEVDVEPPKTSYEYAKTNTNWSQTAASNNGGNIYGSTNDKDKKDDIGFGIASLVLGIISLIFFCTCCNILTSALAIIFGIIQITTRKRKGLAIGGIITAALSIIFAVISFFVLAGNVALMESMPGNLEDIMPYLYEQDGNPYSDFDLDLDDF